MTEPNFLESDFSLMLGGPIFQSYVRWRLSGTSLELLRRRMTVITLVVWLPLLLLTVIAPGAGRANLVSFIRDIEVHVRFLIALPVLIAAEVIVHRRLRFAVRSFVERGIVRPEDRSAYERAIESALRLRNSLPIETGMIVCVYAFGLWLWTTRDPSPSPTWYSPTGDRLHLTLAGFWYVLVSIPIFQVILVRWYLRLFIWFRLLWQVSRLNLHLVPTHPDHCAGLAFLGRSAYTFGPILFAQGALVAGLIGNQILNEGEHLLANKFQVGGFVAFFLFFILAPLLMFTPGLLRSKRRGLADYGLFGERYVDGFEKKWIDARSAPPHSLLGSPDIQSLADLANSYAIVRQMRLTPFSTRDIMNLAAVTAAPLTPLLLTVFPAQELIKRLIQLLF